MIQDHILTGGKDGVNKANVLVVEVTKSAADWALHLKCNEYFALNSSALFIQIFQPEN